jgi:alpha-glucosidase
MDTETIKKYIRFASYMGFPYMLIDWQWYGAFNSPGADITKVNPAVDMPEVLRYAKEKNVRCWVWLYWTDAEKQYKDAFALYEKWGIAGVKIDFMDRDDQEMVNWYHKIVKNAAAHHLMVNFHGAFKPDGFSRTYPNLMNVEGVAGEEAEPSMPPEIKSFHDVMLPFTRCLMGPVDYTPQVYKTSKTQCHQVALISLYPGRVSIRGGMAQWSLGGVGGGEVEFVDKLPNLFDEKKVVTDLGRYVTVARRAGDNWYVASAGDHNPRSFKLPLDFLKPGVSYNATIYSDVPGKLTTAQSRQKVTSTSIIPIVMEPHGGHLMIIEKGEGTSGGQ